LSTLSALDNRFSTIYAGVKYRSFMMEVRPKNRIRELRKEKGLKQSDLAKKVGVFQSELSEIETGVRKPNVYLAKRIARVLKVSLDEIF
jgi:putative transcriptional regulator